MPNFQLPLRQSNLVAWVEPLYAIPRARRITATAKSELFWPTGPLVSLQRFCLWDVSHRVPKLNDMFDSGVNAMCDPVAQPEGGTGRVDALHHVQLQIIS